MFCVHTGPYFTVWKVAVLNKGSVTSLLQPRPSSMLTEFYFISAICLIDVWKSLVGWINSFWVCKFGLSFNFDGADLVHTSHRF